MVVVVVVIILGTLIGCGCYFFKWLGEPLDVRTKKRKTETDD